MPHRAPRLETTCEWAHVAIAATRQRARKDGGGQFVGAVAVDDDFVVRWRGERFVLGGGEDGAGNPSAAAPRLLRTHVEDQRLATIVDQALQVDGGNARHS